MKGLLYSIRITGDVVFNLLLDTQGDNAAGLSLHNTGEVSLTTEDGANEEVAPRQCSFVGSETVVANTVFRVTSRKETGKRLGAIMCYTVPQPLL